MSVSLTPHDNIALITIERADRRNAVDRKTADALVDIFTQFDTSDQFDVAVLTGQGGNFCAGADLKAISQGGGNSVQEEGMTAPMGPSRMRLSKPVIAAVEGYAVAGGLELALWCDIRVAAETAIFGVFCRRFGVPLIDLGTIRLPRLIGQSRATDMILTGREVKADEALSFGLANRIVPTGSAVTAAIELAQKIAGFPQACMRSDRQSMYEQWDLSTHEAIRNEIRLGLTTIQSGETLNGATAFAGGTGRHGSFQKP